PNSLVDRFYGQAIRNRVSTDLVRPARGANARGPNVAPASSNARSSPADPRLIKPRCAQPFLPALAPRVLAAWGACTTTHDDDARCPCQPIARPTADTSTLIVDRSAN